MELSEKLRFNESLREIFTPSKPVRREDIFAGRLREVAKLLDVISSPGQHAIVWGDRGVGKTSLVNVLTFAHYSHKEPVRVVKCSASQHSSFYSIWNDILKKIEMPADIAGGVADEDDQPNIFENKRNKSYADTIPIDAQPSDVIEVLRSFPFSECAIIVDEFDRIEDKSVSAVFADLLKQLSDDDTLKITLILVGVAENIEGLIKEHASIERCTKQIEMPHMPQEDLEEIVAKGFKAVGMEFIEYVPTAIARLSQGFPQYTHQLCLRAGFIALARDRSRVEIGDVRVAINDATEDAEATIRNGYATAIRSTQKDNLFERVLIACALATPDELGYFAPVDVREPLSNIVGVEFRYQTFSLHLAKFCSEDRGPILERIQIGFTNRWKYRFKNPLMRPYVFLRGARAGLIPPNYSPF